MRLLQYILISLAALISTTALAQNTFEIVNPDGCAPFGAVIHVVVPTSGNTFLWQITAPNGTVNTSTSATYVSILTQAGTYDVSLTINGSSTESVEDYITVYSPPTASFSANEPIGCAPHCTEFTNSSAAGSAPITSFTWDFGDGYTSSLQSPNHCYQDVGNYSPILSVTDTNGCYSNLSIVSLIQLPANTLQANFSADQLVTCDTPTEINFSNSSTGNVDFTSFWNFGDGSGYSTENLLSQNHTYATSGGYQVCLLVVDIYGCNDEACQEIQVIEQNLPEITCSDLNICIGESVVFEINSSSAINNVQWDFNSDGEADNSSLSPEYIYNTSGSYQATAIVSHENGCIQTVSQSVPIVVSDLPSGNITTSAVSSCVVPFTPAIAAIANGQGPFTYHWYVNDENSGTGPLLEYDFQESGTYDIAVSITDTNGCIATINSSDQIHINTPQISLVHYSVACIGQDFTPTDFIVNTTSEITSYSWDFHGDGIEDSTDSIPTFVYQNTGEYSITVSLETADGCNAIHTSETQVLVIEELTTEFTTNFTETCAAQFIQFCAPEGTLNTYSWNFGNGASWSSTTSLDNCVEYTYDDTGYFDIRLRVTRGACISRDTLVDFIHIAAPVALFSINVSCDDHLTVTVYDESIGASTLEWNFGDNSDHIFNETIVAHTYQSFGNYQIRLTASDGNPACDYTEVHTVRLKEPDASVIFNTTSGCAPLYAGVTENTSNNYWEVEISNGDSFVSDWNGGQDVWEVEYIHGDTTEIYDVPEGETFWPNFIFTEEGCYDFTFTIYDRYNCPDVEHYEDVVCALSSVGFAQIEYNAINDCDPVELMFTSPGQNIMITEWSFGDGNTSEETSPTHVFLPPYDLENGLEITLHAIDNNGCESNAIVNPEVSLPSTPNFEVASSTTCLGENIIFANTTVGPVASYSWSFGDPTSGNDNYSNLENPSHTYLQNGVYEVCLTVVSPSGCGRTYCNASAVEISTPQVDFTFSSAMSNCLYGVQFESTNPGNNIGFEWHFGDNQIGFGPSVFHTYPIGVFDVTLLVTGSNGCVDSLHAPDIFSYGNQIGPYTTVAEEQNCAPFHVEFEAFDPTDNYFTYFWDFNDGFGIPSGEVSVSHDYLSSGLFCPQLIMTDPNGCEVFVPCENPISVNDFVITHTIPTALCVGDSVLVSLDNGESYLWNHEEYVDAGSVPNEFIIHPTSSVDFVVTGIIGDCESIDTVHVQVNALPLVSLALPQQLCVGSEPLELLGGMPQGELGVYTLSGATVTSFDPSLEEDAWYSIQYAYTDANGCVNVAQDSIFIRPLPEVTLSDIAPLCENAEALSLAGGFPENGHYTMGDTLVDSFHPAIGFGSYGVTYTFTDSVGCTSSAYREIVVHGVPEIELSFNSVCANIGFELVNSSSSLDGEIVNTEWTFGSEETIYAENPGVVHFASAGEHSFHVKTESEYGCIAELDTLVSVHAVPQSAFSVQDGCAGAELVYISESSIEEGSVDAFEWQFNGSSIGSEDTLLYSFDDWGSQTLDLISTSDHGCVDTLSQQVSVFPLPEVSVFSTDVCLGELSVFNSAVAIDYGAITGFTWVVGDSVLTSSSDSAHYLFSAPGSFQATLMAQSDNGCVSSSGVMVQVNNGPVVEFAVEQPGYCPESDVYFFDLSSVDSPGSEINQWAWYFDGVLMSNTSNPVFHLVEPASYDVTLTVSTNTGCSSSLTMDNFVTVYPKPTAGFVVEESEVTMGNPFIEVINTSSNDVTSWLYDFGDGATESFENGSHEYFDWTAYSITQTVSNIFGCTDAAHYEVTVFPSIIVHIPNAFSPDGNGHNDVFFPVLYGSEVLEYEFDIYDRWGRLMFEAASTEDGWDGTIRSTGEMAPCGVYNWKMQIRTIDQPLLKQTMGSVMLVR